MTKSDLAARIAKLNAYMSVRNADRIVSIIIDKIIECLKNGSRVELRGFGSFGVKERNSMEGRNPRTGKRMFINAKKMPFFRPGRLLKDAINKNATMGTATVIQLDLESGQSDLRLRKAAKV